MVLPIEGLSLQADVGEVNEVLGRSDGLTLLPCDYQHSEALSDAPGHQKQLFIYFDECYMENYGKQKQDIAEKHNKHVQFVPDSVFSYVLHEAVHPDPESQVHADGGVEQQLNEDESWRLCNFESIDDSGHYQDAACGHQPDVKVLAVRRIVNLLQ
jgi:hypothetical protein